MLRSKNIDIKKKKITPMAAENDEPKSPPNTPVDESQIPAPLNPSVEILEDKLLWDEEEIATRSEDDEEVKSNISNRYLLPIYEVTKRAKMLQPGIKQRNKL